MNNKWIRVRLEVIDSRIYSSVGIFWVIKLSQFFFFFFSETLSQQIFLLTLLLQTTLVFLFASMLVLYSISPNGL